MKNKLVKFLKDNEDKILIVHYSCQDLNDSNEGYSPRITSIVVHNVKSRTSHSFSIHLEAEVQKVSKAKIETKYNDLEKAMLKNFYDFVKANLSHIWLHWNMRNMHYGFETIAHRYKVLGARNRDIPSIPDDKRVNLSDVIMDVYGENCVSHPRMGTLMKLNGGEPKGFLAGAQEAEAFKQKEYVKLHESTLCKIGWFRKMFLLLLDHKIKTERSNWHNKVHDFYDSALVKVCGIVGIIITLSSAAIWSTSKLQAQDYLPVISKPLVVQNGEIDE